MKIKQFVWTESTGWQPEIPGDQGASAQLVLLFGTTALLEDRRHVDEVAQAFPNATVFGCSSGGDIFDTQVLDDAIVITAVSMEHTQVKGACVRRSEVSSITEAGERLAKSLNPDGLVHTLVLSEGLHVDGNELVRSLSEYLPEGVTVTGGHASTMNNGKETYVVYNDIVADDAIAILGFYGNRLSISYASFGGWHPFGPERLVTKSQGRTVYELDGRSALQLYKEYLGEHSVGLPTSAWVFPLNIGFKNGDPGVVRTVLAVNEDDGSITCAGTIPVGSYVRLMSGNYDHLIEGAYQAANTCCNEFEGNSPELALVVSCGARRMVLKQRVEEEIEAVRDVTGPNTVLCGFYSHGEIAPSRLGAVSVLHNQTMTITMFREN